MIISNTILLGCRVRVVLKCERIQPDIAPVCFQWNFLFNCSCLVQSLIHAVFRWPSDHQLQISLATVHAPSLPLQVIDGQEWLRMICYITPVTKNIWACKAFQSLIDNSHELSRQRPFIYLVPSFFFSPWGLLLQLVGPLDLSPCWWVLAYSFSICQNRSLKHTVDTRTKQSGKRVSWKQQYLLGQAEALGVT